MRLEMAQAKNKCDGEPREFSFTFSCFCFMNI